MKRRLLSMFCALALCLGLLPATAWAAEEVSYVAYSWNEDTSTLTSGTKSVTEYTTVTNSDTTWSNGWYVVSGSVSSTDDITITVNGTVNLILPQGSKLDLSYGTISISDGGTLNIYGQESGSGTLTLGGYGRSTSSGISLGSGSALNIHGGTITANGYCYNNKVDAAPGIDVGTGTLTVYGGEVNAEAGTSSNAGYGAGIRVTSGGTVSIYGGTVTATGASNRSALGVSGAGIGGNGAGGSSSSGASAGIGGGQGGTAGSQGGGGTVSIYGGTVTATGGRSTSNVQAPGIGGAVYSSNRGSSGTFSTGTNGSAVITTTGGIQAGTSGCSAIIDNTVYGTVTLPDSLKTLNKDLTVPSGATLILPDGTTTRGAITVNGTLTVDSRSIVTNTGTITVESGGTLTGTGTINNTDSGKVTNNGTNDKVTITYPSTVTVTSEPSGTAGPNQEVTFTATVTGNNGTPTGTVQFKDGETNLGEAVALENGVATYATSTLGIGVHTITAEYIPADDSSYQGSTSGTLEFTVVGDVASIEIKTQPTNTEYKTGDTLNLSGLVITVHYVGSTYTQDIIWSADSGITASIENGTTLYASQHDGKAITITYGDKTATTGNLTVARANPQVTAPTAKFPTYTGAAQELVNKGTTTGGTMQYSLSEDGEYTEAIPTGIDAGQYTVYYKVVGNDDYNDVAAQSVSVTIAKANAQVTAAPKAVENLAFTGLPQNLVTAGSATGGTLVYSLTGNENDYSTAIPTATNVGDYTVWYKVVGDNNHNDTTAQSVSVTIGKAAATVTTAPQAVTGLTYTGNPQALVTAGTAEGGEMQYSTDGSNYYTDIPTGINAGDYTVWYKVVGDENHSDTEPVEITVTISQASIAEAEVTLGGGSFTYTGSEQKPTVTVKVGEKTLTAGDYTVTYSGNCTDAGTYTVTVTGTGNYADTATATYTITPAELTITGATLASKTYDGTKTATVTSVSFGDVTLAIGDDYTATAEFDIADAGTNKTATVTVQLKNSNYMLMSSTYNLTGQTISKATYSGSTGVSSTVLANHSGEVELPGIPTGAVYGNPTGSADLTSLSIEGSVLHYTGGESIAEGQEYEITVPVNGGQNYVDYEITVTLTGSDKQTLTITGVTAQGGTYNGQTQAGYTGTPSAEGYDGGFTVTYGTTDGQAPTDAGTYTVTIAIPEDDAQYVGSTDLQFTIAQKPLTVSVPSPSVYVGDSAPELALTYTGLVDGERVTPSEAPVFTITNDGTEITLEDAVKTAGTYTITWSNAGDTTFTGDANYAIQTVTAGTLTVSVRSSGGTTTYPVQVEENSQNGGVQVSPKNAVPGTLVTVAPQPAPGYELATLTVLDQYGNEVDVNPLGNGNYSFKMPRSRVKVEATFYCTGSELCPTHHLADVLVKAWYHDAVDYVVEHGIMTGTSATTFSPNTAMNRAMVAQILYNLEGQPTVTGESTFTDSNTHWAAKAIAWAQKTGVVSGYGNNTFRPNQAVTREELAQMLYNYAEYKQYDLTASGDLIAFPDGNNVQGWAKTAMSWANGNQLINGFEDDTLRPGGDSTRAQAASILMNFDLNVVKD